VCDVVKLVVAFCGFVWGGKTTRREIDYFVWRNTTI
jgi:hypothetical protein